MKNIEEIKSYKKKSGIYYIIHETTKRVYIGSAVDLGRRIRQHYTDLTSNIHKNTYLQRTWNKNKVELFSFGIVEFVDSERLINREQFWIDFFQSANRDRGFNLTPTAGSTLGYKKTDIQLDNFKIAIQGKHDTTLTLEQASYVKEQINNGKQLTEIAQELDVAYEFIRSIKRGSAFKYVEPQINYKKNMSTKLNESQVVEIKKKLNLGVKVKELSLEYELNHRTISAIKNEIIWKNIGEPITIPMRKKRE